MKLHAILQYHQLWTSFLSFLESRIVIISNIHAYHKPTKYNQPNTFSNRKRMHENSLTRPTNADAFNRNHAARGIHGS